MRPVTEPISDTDATERALRQLREEAANARSCEDAYVEVYTRHLETAPAEVERLTREFAWVHPAAINTATGAPHRVTVGPDGPTGIHHNLGCYRNAGRHETRTTELICQFSSYLDQTDPDEHPEPGNYWATVEVFGRSEEDVEARWLPTQPGPTYAEALAERDQAREIARDFVDHLRNFGYADDDLREAIRRTALPDWVTGNGDET